MTAPFLPGDLVKVVAGDIEFRPEPKGKSFADSIGANDGWFDVKKGELLTVLAVGDLQSQTGDWRWHMFLVNSTLHYGWHVVQLANPNNKFRKVYSATECSKVNP